MPFILVTLIIHLAILVFIASLGYWSVLLGILIGWAMVLLLYLAVMSEM